MYEIRREKGIEHSRTMKINPFGGQTTTKQEPLHYINNRGGRYNSANNQVDHIRADHKTQEGNKEITIQTPQNNIINVETNTIRMTFNLAQRKIKFVQNVRNEAILRKFADLQTLII